MKREYIKYPRVKQYYIYYSTGEGLKQECDILKDPGQYKLVRYSSCSHQAK